MPRPMKSAEWIVQEDGRHVLHVVIPRAPGANEPERNMFFDEDHFEPLAREMGLDPETETPSGVAKRWILETWPALRDKGTPVVAADLVDLPEHPDVDAMRERAARRRRGES